MTNFGLGIGLLIFGAWLTFFLRENDGVRSPYLRFPGADMLTPVALLILIVFGVALVISGWQSI
jgi:hypothetical protein